MINSNNRKLCLSGWLKHNNEQEYNTPVNRIFVIRFATYS